ncbi:MAG: F0F1 ATP synthase subunit epsilon [Anaerolineales bacterium]|nr:F0F1 ATP synthase subunit epsilon [Anaerolineales bacterium]
MPIRCEIVSQDRLVYEGDADIVIVPGALGEMGILPGHAPLLSSLKLGVIRVKKENQEEIFTVTGGFVEVQPDIVTILADAAENIEDIDVDRAEEAMQRASQLLAEYQPSDVENYLRVQAALQRSHLRLNAVEQYRKRGQRSRPPGMGTSS